MIRLDGVNVIRQLGADHPGHDVPEVLLQGRDPVSRRAEVQASGTGLVQEEVSQKQVNDILKVRKII